MASRSSQETKLQAAIVKALHSLGYETIRMNSGRAMRGGRTIQLAPAGTPDLLVKWPYCWIEVKDAAKPTSEQLEFAAFCANRRIPHCFARSVSDAVTMVRKAGSWAP